MGSDKLVLIAPIASSPRSNGERTVSTLQRCIAKWSQGKGNPVLVVDMRIALLVRPLPRLEVRLQAFPVHHET